MDTRPIGSLEVPVVGLGCNNFGRRIDEDATRAVLDAALEVGVTFLDTADNYGGSRSETFIGRWMRGRRDRVVLATKFGGMRIDREEEGGAKPSYVRSAAEASLRRLRTDRIDLYQLHTPDATTPIGDTLAALGELVRAGKVREIGCSNFSADQLREADEAAADGAVSFVSVQNELSLLHRPDERDVLPACEELGIAYLPYFPLDSGVLRGKYRRGRPLPTGARLTNDPAWADELLTERVYDRVEALEGFARERGRSLTELAIAWLLAKRPVASVIAGATKPEQIRENAGAAGWTLTNDELAGVDHLLGGPE
ncbi:MAG TPA: aldo/keto reductase [Actinomycetota bacterium]|nr:aldo/keto reductase [Actinomycetota bacterium]